MIATVDVVTHEQIVCVRRLSSDLEQLQKVMKLTMDITADGHRALHVLNI